MSNLHVKDCLGSVRSVVDLSGGTVLEQNDYYAYGERVADSTMQTTSINRWRYNAKEEQDSIASIPYLDYGARLYDPVIGRWLQQDPMAEKYPHLSPYNFCGDNPVNFVDPEGFSPSILVGAVTGAALDVAIQVTTNFIQGQSFMSAINNNDAKSVLISGAAGAMGAGITSKVVEIGKLMKVGKATLSASQIASGAVVSGTESIAIQLASGEDISVTQTLVDASIGAASEGVGVATKNAMQKSPYMKVLENQLDHAERVTRGNNPRPSRVAKVNQAMKKEETYGDGKASRNKYSMEYFAEEFKSLIAVDNEDKNYKNN